MTFFQACNRIKDGFIHDIIFSTLPFNVTRPESLLQLLNGAMFQTYSLVPGHSEKHIWSLTITASAEDLGPFLKCQLSGVILSLQQRLGHCGLIRTRTVHFSSAPAASELSTCKWNLATHSGLAPGPTSRGGPGFFSQTLNMCSCPLKSQLL